MLELLQDPITYLVLGALGALGKLALDRWVTRAVGHQFDERLEDHRHALQITAEQARYEFQRDLADYNRLAARRFEAAEQTYSAARVAHGAVAGLFGVRQLPSFEGCNEHDVTQFLEDNQVPQGTISRIIETLRADWDKGVDEAHKELRRVDVHRAGAKLQEARNELYLRELYVSEKAAEKFETLFAALWDWHYRASYPEDREPRKHSREEIFQMLQEVRAALQNEVASSAYQLQGPEDQRELPSGER